MGGMHLAYSGTVLSARTYDRFKCGQIVFESLFFEYGKSYVIVKPSASALCVSYVYSLLRTGAAYSLCLTKKRLLT